MEAKGVWLEAGSNGNLLLDVEAAAKKCTVRLKLRVTSGTEAFVAMRAKPGAVGWQAITARFREQGGKLRVGAPALDFADSTSGENTVDVALEKPSVFKFEIDQENHVVLSGAGKTKFSKAYTASEVPQLGHAGIFVKTGQVFIYSLDVFRE